MAPHQKHYRAKMQRHGWMDAAGNMAWPKDKEGRERMARGLLGIELISNVDYWLLLADDELDDTHDAPWASADKTRQPDEIARREVLKTLTPEQREAVRELVSHAVKGQLHSFCTALDRTLGGSIISIASPVENDDSQLNIHSPGHEELHHEQFQWLEDFSILFGTDERYGDEA